MAVQEYYVNISLKGNEIRDVVVEVADTEPKEGGKAGQIKSYGGNFYISDGSNYHMLSREATVTAIDTRVKSLETTVKGADGVSGLVKDVADIKALIGDGTGSGSIASRVTKLEGYVGEPTGETGATGLFKKVADNATAIGTNTTAIADVKKTADAADALSKDNESRLDTAEPKITTAQGDITTLKGQVGTSEDAANASGTLYARVKKNVSDISGLAGRMTTAENDIDALETGKVNTESGKGLSSNDYTTDEKNKLAGIDEGAQANVIESVELDGAAQAISGKKVTLNLKDYAKKSEVGGAYVYKGSVANPDALPKGFDPTQIGWTYNVENEFQYVTDSGDKRKYPAGTNVAWDGEKWDPLGGMMDLSVYALKTDVSTSLDGKQDNLSETQLKAVNSGITSDKVTTYDEYNAKIATAQSAAKAAQTTANAAVVANAEAPNDAGTPKCKITYDSKGLVTAGADLTVDDLPGSIPFSKTTGVLPYAQSPIMAAQIPIENAPANTAKAISTGMGQVLIAQALDANGAVVFCATTITGGTVSVTFSETFNGKLNVVGLRSI